MSRQLCACVDEKRGLLYIYPVRCSLACKRGIRALLIRTSVLINALLVKFYY